MCRLDSLQVTDSRRWISLTIVWRQHWIQRVTHHFYQHLYAVHTQQEWMMMKVIYLKKKGKVRMKSTVTGILVTPAQRWQVRWVEERWGFMLISLKLSVNERLRLNDFCGFLKCCHPCIDLFKTFVHGDYGIWRHYLWHFAICSSLKPHSSTSWQYTIWANTNKNTSPGQRRRYEARLSWFFHLRFSKHVWGYQRCSANQSGSFSFDVFNSKTATEAKIATAVTL